MRLAIILTLLLLAACSQVSQEPVVEEDYGTLLNFTFAQTTIPLNGEVHIVSYNTTETVYAFAYCDIPFALLKKDGNKHVHVYPTYEECLPAQNITLTPDTKVKLEDIPFGSRVELTEGEYLLKVFYSTVAPATHMREFNQVLFVVDGE